MKISKELKSGVISIIAIAVMFWGYNYLKKQNLFDKTSVYYSKFDNVQGLTPSSIVTINGLQVGNVTQIKNDLDKKWSYIVAFTLTNDLPFSVNSVTKIVPPAISGMGSAELIIIPSSQGENAKSGTFLNGSLQEGMISSLGNKMEPLSNNLNKALSNANQLILNLNNTLDTKTQDNLKAAIANLNSTLYTFKNASKSLDQILTDNKKTINSLVTTANATFKNLETVSTDFKDAKISESFKASLKKLDGLLANFDGIMTKVNTGDGSMAKLLNDKALYNNLENASKEMEELLREMKEHPKRFVHFSLFGKKDKSGYVKDTTK